MQINNTSADCKASTKTQIQHDHSTDTQNENTKQKKYGSSREKQYKRSTGAETLKAENTENLIKKFHRLRQNLF